MKNKLHIGKICIKSESDDLFTKGTKLFTNVSMIKNGEKFEKECFFEFDQKYEKYLCNENSDAFVMGLLVTAMENNLDIEFETPISSRLYYQLSTYYLPMVAKYNKKYPLYNIELFGPKNDVVFENNNAVATGCSGGVDSFYTMVKHQKNIEEKFKLTHLVYSSSGTADILVDRIKNNYKKNRELVRKICGDCELEFIECFNNLNEFYNFPYKGFNMFFTTTFGSIAFALQKLIGTYYCSSGTPIENFNINVDKTNGFDGSAFDIFSVLCMNSQNVSFYSSGVEKNRNEKIESISDYKPAQKNLMVCGIEAYGGKIEHYLNCSNCKKCLRTMFSLYTINKLDEFSDVFNVNDFKNNINKRIGKLLYIDHSDFTKTSLENAKKNKIKISKKAYLIGFFVYKPIEIFRKLFRNSRIIRKIYYKLNIDVKMNGYRSSTYEAYKDK